MKKFARARWLVGALLAACSTALPNQLTADLSVGTVGIVACASGACRVAAGESCCSDYTHPAACSTTCPTVADELKCDGPEDCPSGQSCCNTVDDNGSKASCRTSCAAGRDFWACHVAADCASACEAVNHCGQPQACCAFPTAESPGLAFCQERACE